MFPTSNHVSKIKQVGKRAGITNWSNAPTDYYVWLAIEYVLDQNAKLKDENRKLKTDLESKINELDQRYLRKM